MIINSNNNFKIILNEWHNFLNESRRFDALFVEIDNILLENKSQRKVQNPTGSKNFGIQLSALLLAALGVTGFMYKKTQDVRNSRASASITANNTTNPYNNRIENSAAAKKIDSITSISLDAVKSQLEKRELSYKEWERLVRSIIDSEHFSADELSMIGIDKRSTEFLDQYLEKLPQLLKICERKIEEENFTKGTLSSFGVDQESFQELFLNGEADQFVNAMSDLFSSDSPEYVDKTIQTLFSSLDNEQIDPEIKDIINALGTAIKNPERLNDPSFIKMVRSSDAQELLKTYAEKISEQLRVYEESDY